MDRPFDLLEIGVPLPERFERGKELLRLERSAERIGAHVSYELKERLPVTVARSFRDMRRRSPSLGGSTGAVKGRAAVRFSGA